MSQFFIDPGLDGQAVGRFKQGQEYRQALGHTLLASLAAPCQIEIGSVETLISGMGGDFFYHILATVGKARADRNNAVEQFRFFQQDPPCKEAAGGLAHHDSCLCGTVVDIYEWYHFGLDKA